MILVQYDVTGSGPHPRVVVLEAEVGVDLFMHLTTIRRSSQTAGATTFAPQIGPIKVGHDAVITLGDSSEGINQVAVGNLHVVRYTPNNLPNQDPAHPSVETHGVIRHYRPDAAGATPDVVGGPLVLVAYGTDSAPIDVNYTFTDIRAGNNISIKRTPTSATPVMTLTVHSDVDATWTDSDTGLSHGTTNNVGKIDLLTNGFIVDTEQSSKGDLRVGDITSDLGDVTLNSPAAILDADSDAATDVTGRNITMVAGDNTLAQVGSISGRGGVGTPADFLEINVAKVSYGVLTVTDTASSRTPFSLDALPVANPGSATGTYGAFLTESTGNLNVAVVVTDGDASLVTVAGSIIDGRSGGSGDNSALAPANVVANRIWLDANGGSIGTAPSSPDATGNDLKIDSATAVAGSLVGLEATDGIYLTEITNALDLLLAQALGTTPLVEGNLRITVRESSAQGENLVLHQPTDKILVVQNTPRLVHHGLVNVPNGWVLLRVGDNVTLGNTAPIATSTTDLAGNTQILAGKWIDIFGDFGDLDTGFGTVMGLHGTITPGTLTNTCEAAVNPAARTCNLVRIFGNADADTFTFDQTYLGGKTRAYGSNTPTVSGGTAPVCGLGRTCEDLFVVDRLQTMAVALGHTLTLDGQESTDSYVVYTTGSRGLDRTYVINVLDTGKPDEGVDTLDIYGYNSPLDGILTGTTPHPADDIFLLRSSSYIGSTTSPGSANELALRPSFVAVLHTTLEGARGSGTPYPTTGSFPVERINYDSALNGRLSVYGLGGNDYYAVDDNSAVTTLDGGSGNDTFQIGQLYGLTRDCLNPNGTPEAGCSTTAQTPIVPGDGRTFGGSITPQDVFATIATTRGWLSAGASEALIAKGGTGDDQFTVYSNQAPLRLEGDDDNDLFVVRAFALAQTTIGGILGAPDCDPNTAGPTCRIVWINALDKIAMPRLTSGFSTAADTEIRTGDGVNQVEYNINAPVSIDGGNGFDKVVILGTEFADHIVVTEKAVFGAGLTVTYVNVEVLEIDTLEGDDTIDVLSTKPGILTRVIGGLGSDVINVAGDVTGDVVSRDIEGTSGTINHNVTSEDVDYDGLLVDGIDLSVARPGQGQVIISETGGFTEVFEGGCLSLVLTTCVHAIDSYTVRLAVAPAAGKKVYVTVTAALSPQQEQANGDTMWLSTSNTGSVNDYQHDVTVNGPPSSKRPNRALVLVFDEFNWNTPQNVFLFAVNDARPEGDRIVTTNHSVISQDANFDAAIVRNVEVTIHDNDLADVFVVPVDPNTLNPDGDTKVLEGATPTTEVVDVYKIQLAIAPAAGETVTVTITPSLIDGQARVCLTSTDGLSRFASADASCPAAGTTYTVQFTLANWNIPLYVTVHARDDFARQDAQNVTLTHTVSSSGGGVGAKYTSPIGARRLDVFVIDDENPGAFVRESDGSTLVTACGATCSVPGPGDYYDIRLNRAPNANVTVALVTDGQTDVAEWGVAGIVAGTTLGAGRLITDTAAGGALHFTKVGGTARGAAVLRQRHRLGRPGGPRQRLRPGQLPQRGLRGRTADPHLGRRAGHRRVHHRRGRRRLDDAQRVGRQWACQRRHDQPARGPRHHHRGHHLQLRGRHPDAHQRLVVARQRLPRGPADPDRQRPEALQDRVVLQRRRRHAERPAPDRNGQADCGQRHRHGDRDAVGRGSDVHRHQLGHLRPRGRGRRSRLRPAPGPRQPADVPEAVAHAVRHPRTAGGRGRYDECRPLAQAGHHAAGRDQRSVLRRGPAAAGVAADRRPQRLRRRQPPGPHRHADLHGADRPEHGLGPRLPPDLPRGLRVPVR